MLSQHEVDTKTTNTMDTAMNSREELFVEMEAIVEFSYDNATNNRFNAKSEFFSLPVFSENLNVRQSRKQTANSNFLVDAGSDAIATFALSDQKRADILAYTKAKAVLDKTDFPIPKRDALMRLDIEVIDHFEDEMFLAVRTQKDKNGEVFQYKIWPTSHKQLHKVANYISQELGFNTLDGFATYLTNNYHVPWQ